MTLLFVRHAIALRREDWTRDDDLRPLTPRGYQQAEALPALLEPYAVDRILSSPSTRCVETVQPLAARLGLPVEEIDELAEGSGAKALARIDGLPGTIVVCSHGDVLPELVSALEPSVRTPDGEMDLDKGSTWVVEGDGAPPRYLPPPA
jgi:8-oxo-dGTP diphosphatase